MENTAHMIGAGKIRERKTEATQQQHRSILGRMPRAEREWHRDRTSQNAHVCKCYRKVIAKDRSRRAGDRAFFSAGGLGKGEKAFRRVGLSGPYGSGGLVTLKLKERRRSWTTPEIT